MQFDLGHQDHRKVEDFLAGAPAGVAAVRLDARAGRRQTDAAEAARDMGADVLWDPKTERLAEPDPGGALAGLPGATDAPIRPEDLVARPGARRVLEELVLDAHPESVTIITPPSFFIDGPKTAWLAADLAIETARLTSLPVRPRLLVSNRLEVDLLHRVAVALVRDRIRSVELQVSPLTAENEGLRKIRQVFALCDALRRGGLEVTLGQSGNVGFSAAALGHVAAFSVGVGQHEHVDFKASVRTQVHPAPPRLDETGAPIRGIWQGVYLPPLAATVAMRQARELLQITGLRSRIGCRIDACRQSVDGPLLDHRMHYLHARAAEVHDLEETPMQWRAQRAAHRLTRALDLRRIVNTARAGHPPLKTRTLESLLADIEEERAVA